MVDRDFPILEPQGAVDDQRHPGGNHLQIVGMDLAGTFRTREQTVFQAPAYDLVESRLHRFQITGIAALQAARPVPHVHGVRGAIEQCAHELQLVIQSTFGVLALFDLAAQPGVPQQRRQQQQSGPQQHFQGKAPEAQPIAVIMLAVATPAVVDHPQLFRRNAQQRLVQNRCQFCCLRRGGHGEARRIGTDGAADDQFGVTCYGMVGIDQGCDDGIDCATA
ncbi:hypothetical protein D3C81_1144720 [compost metagenome]